MTDFEVQREETYPNARVEGVEYPTFVNTMLFQPLELLLLSISKGIIQCEVFPECLY